MRWLTHGEIVLALEMNGNDDSDRTLLERLRLRKDAVAVAEVVRRYAGLVYGAALRRVAEPAAGEVCVGVFADLIGDSAQVAGALPVWLHAAVLTRTPDAKGAVPAGAVPEWAAVAPHLDAAIGRLAPLDQWHVLVNVCALPPRGHADSQRNELAEALAEGSAAAMARLWDELHTGGVTLGATDLAVAINANAIELPPPALASRLGQLALAALPATPTLTEHPAMGRARLYLHISIALLMLVLILGLVVYALSDQAAKTAERRASPQPGSQLKPAANLIRPA